MQCIMKSAYHFMNCSKLWPDINMSLANRSELVERKYPDEEICLLTSLFSPELNSFLVCVLHAVKIRLLNLCSHFIEWEMLT